MDKCSFCNILQKKNNIVFENKSFIFMEDNYPIYKGHYLLISKKHLRDESEIIDKLSRDYLIASNRAFKCIKEMYKKSPLIFINAPQDQSVKHFHKHYIQGVFGVLGVINALKKHLKTKK